MKQLVVVSLVLSTLTTTDASGGSGGPDGGGYVWHDSDEPGLDAGQTAWLGATTTEPGFGEETVTAIALPAPMRFYDLPAATTVWVSDNGWLAFQNPGAGARPGNLSLPAAAAPRGLLAFHWDDLDASAGFLTHGTLAGGGYGLLMRVRQRASGRLLQTKVELFPSGRIKVIYLASGDVATLTVGTQDGARTTGTLLAFDGARAAGFVPKASYAFELLPPSALSCGGAPVGCGVPVGGDTRTGAAGVASWGCSGSTLDGSEVIFPVDIDRTSSLTATLSGFAPRALEVFILSACHESLCLAGGGASAVLPVVAPGRYYVAVDGASAVDDGPFTLTIDCGAPLQAIHTGWLEHPGEGVVVPSPPFVTRGDPAEFDYMSFPPRDDPGWRATPDPNFVSFDVASTLCGHDCGAALEFTYYRTCLFLPATMASLIVRAGHTDDGIAVSINGTLVDTGPIGAYQSPELAGHPALAPGDLNDIEVIHVDDCCTDSVLTNLTFLVDGAAASAALADSCQLVAAAAPVSGVGCPGDPILLDASSSAPGLCTQPLLFRWRADGLPLGPYSTVPSLMVSPMASTAYSVDVLCPDECGCVRSAAVDVAVSPAMTVDLPSPVSVCPGDSVTLGGAPTATGGVPPLGFAWAPPDFLDDASSPNPISTPAATQAYTLTVTDSAGCTAMSATLVDVSGGVPASVGNTLRAVRVSADVAMSWASVLAAQSYNVKTDVAKTFVAPTVLVNAPLTTALDPAAVPGPPSLVFYRVNGVGCAGEGP